MDEETRFWRERAVKAEQLIIQLERQLTEKSNQLILQAQAALEELKHRTFFAALSGTVGLIGVILIIKFLFWLFTPSR